MDNWTRALPAVPPFYAVKCNPNATLLGALAALGANFDCASRSEIESVLSLGVSPDRIVFANPCKSESHIKYAASLGVNLTTFDSVHELHKLQKFHPQCDLLLRIKPPDDGGARCPLGPKYGALTEEIVPLIQATESSNLKVIGVSFHIGTGATQSRAYFGAIDAAKKVFETADLLGIPRMKILNIGGGFTAGEQFEQAATEIKAAIESYFAEEPELTIISEPGRYFSESAFTLAANIIGKREGGELREYWINDGLYGSMNCILYDHATVTCLPLACNSNRVNPTCDALDTVLEGYGLPELQVDDWVVFPNMGAYTMAAGSNFNGFDTGAILTYLGYSNPGLG